MDRQQLGAQLMAWISRGVSRGLPMLHSSEVLASTWRAREELGDLEARLARMVRHETRKTFGVGVVMGLGASVAAPVGVPTAVATAWLMQARLVGAIASLRGFDLHEPAVQADVLQCLVGAVAPEGLRQVTVSAGEWAAKKVAGRIGKGALKQVQARLGARLLAGASSRGLLTAGRVVPVLGAVVGGGVDWIGTRRVARRALLTFAPQPPALTS